jgi:hypothetical protein
MPKTREYGAEVGIPGFVKLATKATNARGTGQVSVQAFVVGAACDPCPPVEHLHVWVQATEPIIVCHVDLVDADDIGRYEHYPLDDVIAAQDDMRAGDPFEEGLCFQVAPGRDMCAMALTEDVSEDWRDRELLVRCTDAADNVYFSKVPFSIDPSPED